MAVKFQIVQGKDKLSANAGLAIVGAIINKFKVGACANLVKLSKGVPLISNSDVIASYLGLLSMGRTNFGDIELYRKDETFKMTVGVQEVPSEGTLRQRFDAAAGAFDPWIRKWNDSLLGCAKPTPLKAESGSYMPVDLDVSCLDNSGTRKEKVGCTYHMYEGFSPIFAYVGLEGYMLGCELRPGVQHCQNGTPDFIGQLLKSLHEIRDATEDCLFRMDSGNDASDNIVRLKDKAHYLIKRNLRKEKLQDWLELAKKNGKACRPRDGKAVWTGDTAMDVPGAGSVRVVFEVIERMTVYDRKSKSYVPALLPEIEVATYWTSLPDSPAEVIRLYRQHGTSEQFHSELKTDMDVERLPSGKFATNSTILLLSMLSFNMLRRMGSELLSFAGDLPVKLDVGRRRIRSVIMDIVLSSCKLIRGGGRFKLKMGVDYAWFAAFRRLYESFC